MLSQKALCSSAALATQFLHTSRRSKTPDPVYAPPRLHTPFLRGSCLRQHRAIFAQAQAQQPLPPPFSPASPSPSPPDVGSLDDDEDDDPEFTLILVACGIGLATGASVVLFNDAIHTMRDAVWHGETLLTGRQLLQQFSEFELWPKIVLPPVLGGLFVGLFGLAVGTYNDPAPPPQSPPGSPKEALPVTSEPSNDLLERFRVVFRPVARAVAAAVTLGSGASLGPEGPSVDIGRSCAKALGTTLRNPQRHFTSLMAVGSGAGVAAGFNAPIAGVFFAVETVLQRQLLRAVASSDGAQQARRQAQRMQDSSAMVIAMVLLACVLASLVSQAGLGSSPAFRVPEYRLQSLYELPLYLVFGVLCGAVSASFTYSARVAEDAFGELRQGPGSATSRALLPALGGLTTGVLALGYPEILYQGFDNVSSILSSSGDYAPGLLVQIVVMKIIATTISRGSGLQGGLYAPSIFIGSALGSAFGLFVHGVGDPLGLALSPPQAYALVGVAAMLASNCGVPLTAVLLLFELTRDYLILVPTLAAVGISFWISSLAAPRARQKATSRRQRAAALAAAAAAASPADSALFESIKQRLRDGVILQDVAAESAVIDIESMDGGDGGPGDGGSGMIAGSVGVAGSGVGSDDEDPSLLLACAADRGCLLLQDSMTLSAALALIEAEGQTSAVVLGSSGMAVGLVTREIAAAAEGKDSPAAEM